MVSPRNGNIVGERGEQAQLHQVCFRGAGCRLPKDNGIDGSHECEDSRKSAVRTQCERQRGKAERSDCAATGCADGGAVAAAG